MPFTIKCKLPGVAPLAALVLLGGCARSVQSSHPRLANPTHIESFCGFRVPRPSAILSVLTSTWDHPPAAPAPPLAELRAQARRTSGATARWEQPQPLELPNFAREFGESDGFVRVRAAAILPPPADAQTEAQTRPIAIDVRDHGAWRWIGVQAYDRQDVCVEGQRSF